MIVKRIPASPAGRDATVGRAQHARRLVDYLRLPEKDSAEKAYQVAYMLGHKLGDTTGERLFHIGARGFITDTIEGQRAEMIAVANEAGRSPNPIDHWLLSWREGELPTSGQIDEVVAMFVEHLGVGHQPCIYACHGDTDNRHVHIALNRYDAVNDRMIEINGGFTHEAGHQAVALIVDRFGWQPEADARYEVLNGRVDLTQSARDRQADGRKAMLPDAAAFENRTGYRSAQRIAQEEAVPLIERVSSWSELHHVLAPMGMRYDQLGSGATISVDDERVKSSDVHRTVTRNRLEKRLGPFEARDPGIMVIKRDAELNRFPEAFRADEYRDQRERWKDWQNQKGARRRKRGHERQIEDGTADIVPLATSDVEAEQAKPAPNLESFYYDENEGIFAERWRKRRTSTPFPALTGTPKTRFERSATIDSYHAYVCSDGIRYARGENQPTAFIDRGKRIDVVAKDDDAALLAALKLAAIKFDGRVAVNGTAEFRERAFAVAQANGLGHVLADADFVARRAPWRNPSPSPTPAKSARPPSRRYPNSQRKNADARRNAAPGSARIHEPAYRRSTVLGSTRHLAGMRILSALGMDDRQQRADRLLLGIPGANLRHGSEDLGVRGPRSAAKGPPAPVSKAGTAPVARPPKPPPGQANETALPDPTRRSSLRDLAATLPAGEGLDTAKGPEDRSSLPPRPRKGPER